MPAVPQSERLRGRVAVVTGACSGIGLEFATQLAAMGADIVGVSNRREPLMAAMVDLSSRFGIRTHALTLDLTLPDGAERVMAFLEARRLKPYVLVNNAGIFSFNPVVETPMGRVECFIDLHVRAVTKLSRLLGEEMLKAGEGYILNMSSMSCWMPMPGIALYSATKAYIRAFSRALHYELRQGGVRVMVACPGGIATDLFGLPDNLKRLAVGIGALATPERFVRKALRRLLKGRSQYINGGLNRVAIVAVGMMPRPGRMLVKTQLLDKNIRRP